ncbi:flagellar assembly protein FliH [Campylobacterota bacterium]|nr:flagellar assembly protein FliH [Campylobacterota bacterium]
MEIIITPERVGSHKIVKYNFKNFDTANTRAPTQEGESMFFKPQHLPKQPSLTATLGNLTAEDKETLAAIDKKLSTESDMVAALVGKMESFGDNVVKLQMQLEKQEAEFVAKLEQEKQRSFDEGRSIGENDTKNAILGEVKAQKDQLAESLIKLENALVSFGAHSASLEKELSSIAVEIASEVITLEVSARSGEIAKALSLKLLEEIKDAQKITIRANPDDATELITALGSDPRVKITTDRAVAAGGVVISSDAGNINAELHHRFAAIKKSILEGGAT